MPSPRKARSGTALLERRPRPSRPYDGPLNRVVERDPWSRQVEVWHARDGGDPRELLFYLPRGLRPETVAKAFRHYGMRWVEWLARQGVEVVDGTVRCHGPYPCLELDRLDCDQYVVSALTKRRRPEVMKAEDAKQYFDDQPVTLSLPRMLGQVSRLGPGLVEANARAQAEAQKVAPAARAEREAVRAWRRSKGLPEYQEG